MVGVAYLKNYLCAKDKNGRNVGDWAVEVEKGKAKCRLCSTVISFKNGKRGLLQHSETNLHIKAIGASDTSAARQRSVGDMLKAQIDANVEDPAKAGAKKLEIQIVAALSRHQVSLNLVECLVPILKKCLPDCATVQEIKLSREKARYISNKGIAPIFAAETIEKLKNCDAFVVGFDETAINKKEEMEIVFKIANPDGGIEMRHYKTVELEAGDAETITNTLLEAFEEDGIEYEKTLISTSTDWCSVMGGGISGVNKRISDQVPQLLVTGGCPAHHIGNTIKAMVKAFDPDLKDALVNLSECIGGEKGRSLKQMHEFERIAKEVVGKTPGKIRKFVETRWRSIRHCAADALKEEDVIYYYLKNVKKPTERQKKLQKYFVEQKEMTRLKLRFVVAATTLVIYSRS